MFTCKTVDVVGLTERTIFLAAVVAVVGAALVAAFSIYRAGVRTKRKDTLEAWAKWSDDTREARRNVSRVLVKDKETVTEPQAKALLHGPGGKLKDKYGTLLDESERRELSDQVRDILNGLERLALGVQKGIYDVAILRSIGRTVIAGTHTELATYIKLTQAGGPRESHQINAFKQLGALYRKIGSEAGPPQGSREPVQGIREN